MTSHRQIFRSSAVIGGASVINMLIGIAKVKLLAVLLGPAGIGLMGLYQNIMGMAATLAGCGMQDSGVRQLAATAEDRKTRAIVQRALWTGLLVLGLAGMAILWLLRESVALWVFGDAGNSKEVGWLGVGVLLTLVAGSQMALLQGLRRVDDLARVSVLSAVVAAAAGILAIYLLGADGMIWFVVTAPAANALVAGYYAARLPRIERTGDLAAIQHHWLAMLRLGIPLMSAALLTLVTQLAVRAIVLREFGLEASGYFQASWAISMTYVGLVLNAMTTDYFPRLSEAIGDRERARQLVSEQSEMALLLSAPALIGMITLAPWIIHLLYAEGFGPAADILRWQLLGGILKVASVPLVFTFLAAGHGGIAIGIQAIWSAAYLGALLLGLQQFGLLMAGIGFFVAYLVYHLVVSIAANRLIGFRSTRRNWVLTLVLLLTGGITISLAAGSAITGYAFGAIATLLVAIYCLRRANDLVDLTGWLRLKLK